MSWQIALLIFLSLWLLAVSFFLFWLYLHLSNLVRGAKKENLISILDQITKNQEISKKDALELGQRIDTIEEKDLVHIQKIGFVRFNPFKEIGGDHSFSLALLDGINSGFILTGLHTRERTRIYVKLIKEGKCDRELSKEEKEALNKTLKEK